ncbi:uncharacterized protein majin [Denticeps clupeoides]|uniref:uncharacterized protein majin n=1 Tax=Denticeps clupeoides TaxID=299321 RepID=UPI0010A486FD|nr:membrane-anchored junction protein [Denticeps clupeoides]
MPIQAFTFPVPETRFFHAGLNIFKFKIRQGANSSGEETIDREIVNQELEVAVRIVLTYLDDLQPFVTKHFCICPYKSKWESAAKLNFELDGLKLSAYPFIITLYVETCHQRHRRTGSMNREVTDSKDTHDCDPRVTDPGSRHSQCSSSWGWQSKRSETREPHGGVLAQRRQNQNHTDSDSQQFCHGDSPGRPDGAEDMLRGTRAHEDGQNELKSTAPQIQADETPRALARLAR